MNALTLRLRAETNTALRSHRPETCAIRQCGVYFREREIRPERSDECKPRSADEGREI